MTTILGISAFYHDSAAALVVDGEIVAAAQEERFTRKKHDYGFPQNAVEYCLREADLTPQQLDHVGFYDKPLLKFDRLLETYLAYAPSGFQSFLKAMPLWLDHKLHLPREMDRGLGGHYDKPYVFCEHHESHAASAFFPSPFEEAAILTLDGVGEWATGTLGTGKGNRIDLTHEMRFPHSVGLMYSAFTYYCGFKVNSGEYKLMGLAPYGKPVYTELILEKLIDLKEDGSFRMDLSYFNYCQGLTMTSSKFDRLFGHPPRTPDGPIEEFHMDVAASIQKATEEIMLRSARHLHDISGMKNLCLAGGVALNCVGNGRILREGPYDNIWIQPAAGDAGGALGVALLIWYQLLGNPRTPNAADQQRGSLLGVTYGDEEVRSFLSAGDVKYEWIEDEGELCREIANEIADGKIVGWFQGRMEFGPRALGSRSILGDARDPKMQSIINMKVKFREGFRPFAPIVLAEHAHEYFELEPDQESPYMLLVAPVREEKRLSVPSGSEGPRGLEKLEDIRSEIPAVTHVDYSARVQTVDPERHGLLRKLMETFHAKTGCPVMINTSFNLGWDPIVCSPQDAVRTFMSSDIDVLCIGNVLVRKSSQPSTVDLEEAEVPDHVLHGQLVSPCCGQSLILREERLVCAQCGHEFVITDGIPQLFWPHDEITDPGDVTEIVKAFYEETPFPNYDDHDSIRSLIDKARRGLYARRMDESIPWNCDVLEVGCGTGQLTNFLGIGSRRVIGADMCLNSLRLAEAFRRENGLSRVRFVQMNLFRPALHPEQFDVVLCNGVLHHTGDPYGGFRSLLTLVKPGGHVIIGLYNAYARLFTDVRRRVFRATRGHAQWIDPILRKGGMSADKRRAWFADQYQNPHESKHTVREVLRWFDENGVRFVRGVPAVRFEDDGLEGASLFEPQPRGSALDHLAVQLAQVFEGQREGGLFVMIGRKFDGPSATAGTESGIPRTGALEQQGPTATDEER